MARAQTIAVVEQSKSLVAVPTPPQSHGHLALLADFRFHLRRFLAFSESAASDHGVHAQQYQLLQVVAAATPLEIPSIAYVAQRMLIRHNSAVELVARAESEGLLARETDPCDHRRILLRLTLAGDRLLGDLIAIHLQGLRKIAPDMMRSLRMLTPAIEAATQSQRASLQKASIKKDHPPVSPRRKA